MNILLWHPQLSSKILEQSYQVYLARKLREYIDTTGLLRQNTCYPKYRQRSPISDLPPAVYQHRRTRIPSDRRLLFSGEALGAVSNQWLLVSGTPLVVSAREIIVMSPPRQPHSLALNPLLRGERSDVKTLWRERERGSGRERERTYKIRWS